MINKLQDIFSSIGQSPIDLPQIVVIGAQSSGKSSVLESIVCRGFLPRGTGIVTRRPLILQLFKDERQETASSSAKTDSPASKSKPAGRQTEWAEFLHLQGRKFTDFNDVRKEIVNETARTAGTSKGIISKPIRLKIFSPHVLNLTLVDLPGITKVPVGDQPSDIEKKVRDMCLHFISNPKAIILAVTAANTDIANSDALQLAKSVDPDGTRTLGVITKLDLMDAGTDASAILKGEVIPLRLGYIGVVNRSQREIELGSTMEEVRRKEAVFIQNHEVYRSMEDFIGTGLLSSRLNQMLLHHIRLSLPSIRRSITDLLRKTNDQLQALGTSVNPVDKAGQGQALLASIAEFTTAFKDAIDGQAVSHDNMLTELYGGARIGYIFQDVFCRQINDADFTKVLSNDDIRTAIRNATGPRAPLFVPEVAFELLVRRQIATLRAPGLACAESVLEELLRLTSMVVEHCPTLLRFKTLRERLVGCVTKLLRSRLQPTQNMICNLIDIELAYINTDHPHFVGGSQAVAEVLRRRAPPEPPVAEPSKVETVKARISEAAKTTHKRINNATDTLRNVKRPWSSNAEPKPTQTMAEGAANEDSKSNSLIAFLFRNKNGEVNSRETSRGLQAVPQPRYNSNSSNGSNSYNNNSSNGSNGNNKLQRSPTTIRVRDPSARAEDEVEIIKALMTSYLRIVRTNFTDMVPKAIMSFLVQYSISHVQSELVQALYLPENFGHLLQENSRTAQQRRKLQELQKLLHQALEIVGEVRDYDPPMSP